MDYEALPISQGHREQAMRPLRLTVRARDRGNPSLSSDVPLIVYLKDVNDNTPIFERSFYKKNVSEDVRGGTSILQVILERDLTRCHEQVTGILFLRYTGKSLGQRSLGSEQQDILSYPKRGWRQVYNKLRERCHKRCARVKFRSGFNVSENHVLHS